MMSERRRRILGYFIEEAKDHLNTIEQALLRLQDTIQDPDMSREVIRTIDSLGASAATLSLVSIQSICIRLEDSFITLNGSPVRVDVDRELGLLFLNAFEGLRVLVENLQGPFGLTEDTEQDVMALVEPVFERLKTHLNELVTAPTMTPVTGPASSRPASQDRIPLAVLNSTDESSVLQLIFTSDVPRHLREMLTLFKQADVPETRQQLQDICQTLKFDSLDIPTDWKKLVSAAQWAISYEDNTFRQLAPVIIRALKQAQELGLAGRWDEIKANEALDALQPPVTLWREPKRTQCFIDSEIKAKLGIQLDLMLIPGGTFTMGSPENELGRYDDEGPQHDVTVSNFLMGRYPITQSQWRAIVTRTELKVKNHLELDPSHYKGADRPIEQVSWHDAVEFCSRLSKLTGHTYRLPTEAEWEYACRGGTKTPFHFGETITTELANYRGEDNEDNPEKYPGNYGNGPKGVYRKETTTVNHFHPLANAFGICDLHGNVWEWCQDYWHSDYKGATTDGSAWLTENTNKNRVVRGASCGFNPRKCRSASRNHYNPGLRDEAVGFRVVCEIQGS